MGEKLRVNPMFGDHMVLQRDRTVPVWGDGPDGERVVLECRGAHIETFVAEGRWSAALPPLPAGGPCELTVRAGEESIVFRDVRFGDVWLAGGQSNMAWPLKDTAEAEEELPNAAYPEIRYCEIPKIAYEDEGVQYEQPAWRLCTPEQAGEFSAVAYHFAKRLQQELDVPIGIIGCNFGATSAACWMAEERLAADEKLRIYLDEYGEQVRDFDWDAYEVREKQFQADFAAWQARADAGLTGEELGVVPWPPPMSPRSFMRPNGLYGTMLRKAVPYGLKGFIYYQGEGDADKPLLYDRLLAALIANWRDDWGDAELPFLFVQLPAFGCDGDPDGEAWALLRESQAIVREQVPLAGMAVALDCGERDDIHPRRKRTVGERLARVALAQVHGREPEQGGSGPVFAEARFEAGRAVLRFAHAAGGLATADGGAAAGFELAGADGVYAPAQASLQDDRAKLSSLAVPEPRFARYGWANWTTANVIAAATGLPAAPFRTHRAGRTPGAGDVAKL